MTKYFISVVVFLIIFSFQTVFAQEKIIENYDVKIEILQNSDLLVTENILYDFASENKHGIFRNIPVIYTTESGKRKVYISAIEVSRDGDKEQFKTSHEGSDFNIRIGRENKTITGEHLYQIKYTLKGAINYLDGHDELYWKVIAGEWPVDIRQAFATVIGQNLTETKCFIRSEDSSKLCPSSQVVANQSKYYFGDIEKGEDAIIVLAIEKGTLIDNRTFTDKLKALFFIWRNIIVPAIVTVLMLILWFFTGRDAKGSGTIIPRYSPPDDLSLEEMAILSKGRITKKTIPSIIISLAVKGYLKIKKGKSIISFDPRTEYIFSNTEKTDKNNELLFGEGVILREIFSTKNIKIKDGHKEVSTETIDTKTFQESIKTIKRLTNKKLVERGYFPREPMYVRAAYCSIGSVVVYFAVGVIGGESLLIGAVISGIIVFLFGYFMPRRTQKGTLAKEYLKGFKLYLKVAEKDRIKFHNSPKKNPEVFEKYLPYAILFGVEKEWAQQFKGVYNAQPDWYTGDSLGSSAFSSVGLASALGDVSGGLAFFTSSSSGFNGDGGGAGGGGGGGDW